MSSSTEYINAYLENSIGTLHDYLNQILQLKTQLKLLSDSVAIKDETIQNLTSQLEDTKNELVSELERVKKELDSNIESHAKDSEAVNTARANLQKLQDENDSIKHRLSEFDALVKQFADLKNEYKDKDGQVQRLSSELENLKNQKNDEVQKLMSELNETKTVLDQKEKEIKKLEKPIPVETPSPAKKSINTKTTPMKEAIKPVDENDDF